MCPNTNEYIDKLQILSTKHLSELKRKQNRKEKIREKNLSFNILQKNQLENNEPTSQ